MGHSLQSLYCLPFNIHCIILYNVAGTNCGPIHEISIVGLRFLCPWLGARDITSKIRRIYLANPVAVEPIKVTQNFEL